MPEKPQKRQKSPKGPIAAILIIIMVVALYLGWGYLSGNLPWQKSRNITGPRISWLEKEATEKGPVQEDGAIPPGNESATLHITSGEEQPPPAAENECLKTADKILLFFEHLDRQEYMRNYAVKGSSYDHFTGILNKLIANPPVVSRETDDLFAILNNMAHFFRILGPKDILLIKDILIQERELIEPTMALFYKWSEIETGCRDVDLKIKLPLPGLYEYAGYFINTLGGQSYLFRRELYLRILIRYYSILIIDRANSADANRYGIDIRYTLDSLVSEIDANGALANRQEYLNTLVGLQEKYRAQYGGD